MQRRYNKSNGDAGGIGVAFITVGGVVAIVIWVISLATGSVAQQEANPNVNKEFTGNILSASEIDSEYLTHSYLAYNVLKDEWGTAWSYYEKETWEFTLKMDNGTIITCQKVYLANTVNINLYYSDVDGEIPVGINAKVTGSFAEDKIKFNVNQLVNLGTGTEIALHSPALPPGTVSAPAPAAA